MSASFNGHTGSAVCGKNQAVSQTRGAPKTGPVVAAAWNAASAALVGGSVWVNVGEIEGVKVAVLVGGRVDVTNTKSGWLAIIVTGFGCDVATGIAIGEGVGLSWRVGIIAVGPSVTSCTNRGPTATLVSDVQAARKYVKRLKNRRYLCIAILKPIVMVVIIATRNHRAIAQQG